jgi:hypothetical protein
MWRERVLATIAVGAAVAALAACGSSESTSFDAPAFVRLHDSPTVVYFARNLTTYCVVANPSQMDAYGGFQQVHVLPSGEGFPAGAKIAGTCGYPDGVYGLGDKIIVLSGTTICTSVFPKKPDHTVPAGTDLSVGRAPISGC